MPIDGAQFVIGQVGEALPAHLQSADVLVVEAYFLPVEFVAEEGHVESGVVGYKDAVLDEF